MINKKNKSKINENNNSIKRIEKTDNFNDESITNNKIPKTKKILNIMLFIFIVFGILIGSFFSIFEANINNYDINYKGGYGLNISVKNETFDPKTGVPTFSNSDSSEASNLLKEKLDPLNNKNIMYRSWSQHSDLDWGQKFTVVNASASKSTYDDNIHNFINDATRPGFLYFTNNSGKDLLLNSDSRTPVNSVVSSAVSSVDKNNSNKPTINLTVKDASTWNSSIINQGSGSSQGSQASPQEFIIWTDLAYFINDLRNINDINQFQSLYYFLESHTNDDPSIQSNLNKVFSFDNNKGNLITDYREMSQSNLSGFKTELKNIKNWDIPLSNPNLSSDDSESLQSGMNSNNPKSTNDKYINPFRPLLSKILSNKEINKNNQFNKYELADEKTPKTLPSNNIYSISVDADSDAKKSSNLINSGLHGLVFQLNGSYIINPLIDSVKVKISIIILISFILAIMIFLITYYRLFGLICSLGILLMISISYLLIGLLSIEIGPALILAILIILFLNLDSNINFFEHFRKEYHQQNVSNKQSFKLSTKKTLLTIIDYHLILLFLGLAIFIFSDNFLRMFGVAVIILSLVSFVCYILITKLLYYIVIKNYWLDKVSWFRMPKHFKFMKKSNKLNIINKISLNKNNNDLNYNTDDISDNKLNSDEISSNKDSALNNNDQNYKNILKKNKKNIIMFSILSFIIVVSCLLFGIYGIRFGEETMHGNNRNTGTTILILDSNDSSNLNSDITELDKLIHDKYGNQFDYSTNLVSQSSIEDNNYNILIVTSLEYRDSKGKENQFFQWLNSNELADKYKLNFTEIQDCKTTSISYAKMVKQLLIIFSIIILIILIYILIRFNWAQFIAVLGSLLLVITFTILLVNFAHIWITLEMILALLGVIIYVIVDGIILCSKIKYEKYKYDPKNYNNIYLKFKKYQESKKSYRKFFKNEYRKKVDEIILSNEIYSNIAFKKAKNDIKINIKSSLIEEKKLLKITKNEYINTLKNNDENYLIKIKKTIIKESLKRALITSFIFTTIILILVLSGGINFGFGIVILFGINISIYMSLFVLIILWIILDKYNIINSIKINNFFKNYKLDLDEEDIKGINI